MSSFKQKIAKFNLNKRLKHLNRQVRTYNFNTAQTVGILFNSPDNESFESVKEFLSFISQQNIKVIALGYVPAKKVPENFLLRKGINFYCTKDLNWYCKPKNEIVEQFIQSKFDILFDLSIKDYFTINYVGSLSNASFKIGKQSENSYHDLVFDIKSNCTVE